MSVLNQQQQHAFHRDGYVVVPSMFDREEVQLLSRAARQDKELDRHAFGRTDGEGGKIRLTVWNEPGDSIYGMFARCRRIVDSMEGLLEGEVYHYHSKMILKDPQVGGAWVWHQDYGYWYNNGVLFPLMASVMIAVDAANEENGCLQLLKGSHHMGRLDHLLTGEQAGADLERVVHAENMLERVYCNLAPGDALFFHCNLLHRSDQNRSDQARWSLICCYNAARNNPYKESTHPRYVPLAKVDDSEIKITGAKHFTGNDDIAWLNPQAALDNQQRDLMKDNS